MKFFLKNAKFATYSCLILSVFATNTMEKAGKKPERPKTKPAIVEKAKSPYLVQEIKLKDANSCFSWSANNRFISTGNMIISIDSDKMTYKRPGKFPCVCCGPTIEFVPEHNFVAIPMPRHITHTRIVGQMETDADFKHGYFYTKIKKFNPMTGKVIDDEKHTLKINLELNEQHKETMIFSNISSSLDGNTLGEIIYNRNGEIFLKKYNIDFAKNKYLATKPVTIQTRIENGAPFDLNYIPGYKYLAIGYRDNVNRKKLKIMNLETKEELKGPEIKFDRGEIEPIIELMPKKDLLVVLDSRTTAKIIDPVKSILRILKMEKETYKIIKEMKMQNDVSALDISPSGELIAIGNSTTNNIEIINISSGVVVQKLTGHKKQKTRRCPEDLELLPSEIIEIKFSNDGKLIASMDDLDELKIWRLEPLKIEKKPLSDVRIHFQS